MRPCWLHPDVRYLLIRCGFEYAEHYAGASFRCAACGRRRRGIMQVSSRVDATRSCRGGETSRTGRWQVRLGVVCDDWCAAHLVARWQRNEGLAA